MAKKTLSLAIKELETIRELSDRESMFVSGGHIIFQTHLTIGCPGKGKPAHKHYPDGTWGGICIYPPDPYPISKISSPK